MVSQKDRSHATIQNNLPTTDQTDALPPTTPLPAFNQPSPKHKKIDVYVAGVGFLIVLGMSMFAFLFGYYRIHGNNLIHLYTNPGITLAVDFIGGGRNAFSIGFEAAFWTFLGVTCRMAYIALQAMHEGTFRFFKYVAIWLGTVGFAWGVSVAIVLSLSVITVNIGVTTITLADASFETLIAVSFIIGFYHEQALKVLERVRDKFTTSIESSQNSS